MKFRKKSKYFVVSYKALYFIWLLPSHDLISWPSFPSFLLVFLIPYSLLAAVLLLLLLPPGVPLLAGSFLSFRAHLPNSATERPSLTLSSKQQPSYSPSCHWLWLSSSPICPRKPFGILWVLEKDLSNWWMLLSSFLILFWLDIDQSQVILDLS